MPILTCCSSLLILKKYRIKALGGLLDFAAGTFYRYTPDEGPTALLHNIYISNGMTWDLKQNKFYYIDSGIMDVKEYDLEPTSGNISNYYQIVIFFLNSSKEQIFSAYFFYIYLLLLYRQ